MYGIENMFIYFVIRNTLVHNVQDYKITDNTVLT